MTPYIVQSHAFKYIILHAIDLKEVFAVVGGKYIYIYTYIHDVLVIFSTP